MELPKLKYNDDDPMKYHIIKFNELARQVKLAGTKLEEDILSCLLLSLPESYNLVVTAIGTLSNENITWSL